MVDSPDVHGLRRLIMGLALGGHLNDFEVNATESKALSVTREDISAEAAQALRVTSLTCRFERLRAIAELKRGLTPIQRARPGVYPLVVTADARASCDHYDFEGAAVVIPMVSSSGHGKASLKRLHYQEGKFAVGNILCAAFPRNPDLISARFLYEYLTAFKDDLLVPRMVGTANVSLTLEKIGQVPIPVISSFALARLDELMAVCDELEAVLASAQVGRRRLLEALLHKALEGAAVPTTVDLGAG